MRRFNNRRGALAELDREENRVQRAVVVQSGLNDLVNPDLQADLRATLSVTDLGADFLAGSGWLWLPGG